MLFRNYLPSPKGDDTMVLGLFRLSRKRTFLMRRVTRAMFLLAVSTCVFVVIICGSVVRVVPPPFSEDQCTPQIRTGIPKHIHQTWKTKYLPEQWQPFQERCLQLNPGYNYTLWTDDDIDRLIHDHYPWILPLYNSYSYKISRMDVARLLILYHSGGVYLDIDIDCRAPFTSIFNDTEGVDSVVLGVKPFGITNYFMAANKGDTFIKYVIDGLADAKGWYVVPYMTVIMSTGPLFTFSRFTRYPCKERVTLIQQDTFIKYFYHGNLNSWMSWDGKVAVWASKNQKYVLAVIIGATIIMVLGAMYLSIRAYKRRRTVYSKLNSQVL